MCAKHTLSVVETIRLYADQTVYSHFFKREEKVDVQGKNKAEKGARNVVLPEILEKKNDRIFIHCEKECEEPEISDGIE